MNPSEFWADPRVAMSGVAVTLALLVVAGIRPGEVGGDAAEMPAQAQDPLFFEPVAAPLWVASQGFAKASGEGESGASEPRP